jgi:hypothetical protein
MKNSLLVTMLLVPLLILAACGGGEAEPPEATVRAWLDAFYELDADRLVALHIPEQRQVQRPGYESWVAEIQAALAQTGPPSARSSMLRALWTEPAPEGTASYGAWVELEVLSESDTDTVIEARTKPVSDSYSPFRWKFRLSKSGDQWLIHGLSGFVPDGILVWIEVVVSDDQGNPVPGARVTVDAAGQPVTRLTDDSGLAVLPDIMSPVESQDVTVEKEGFKRAGSGAEFGFHATLLWVELRPNVGVHMFMVRTSTNSWPSGVGGATIGPASPGDVEILVLVTWQDEPVPQTLDIVLLVDGEPRDSASVQIPGGGDRSIVTMEKGVSVPFTLFIDKPGTYKVSAGGKSVNLNVSASPPSPP